MQAADVVARRVVPPMAWLVMAAALASGCATSSALRDGRAAERADDYDRAVVEYTKALKEHPDNFDTRQALDRAKLRASGTAFLARPAPVCHGKVRGRAGRIAAGLGVEPHQRRG